MKENEANKKTAVIYCRAVSMEYAKRQQEKAEAKADKLNATVVAVFTDIHPILPRWKQVLLLRFSRFFKNVRIRAIKRKEWRKAMIYLKEHKTDYVITGNPGRLSRNSTECRKMQEDIKRHDAQVVFASHEHTELYDFIDRESRA